MTLTLENVKEIVRGALSVREEDGSFFFERFTEEQKNFYALAYERSAIRTEATASVILDFYTDSETLSFDFLIDQLNYNLSDFLFIDVWEDDLMVAHIGEHRKKMLSSSAKIALTKGEKRVRIFLPNIFKTSISNIVLDDGASLRASEKGRRALILGDSITQGNEAFFPSLTYANTIIRDLDLNAVNQAIGGEIFREEALGNVPLFDAEIITVAYGTNDWAGALNLDEARRYFARLRRLYPGARIFYISPVWREGSDRCVAGFDFSTACAALKSVAHGEGIEVIDGEKIMPKMSEMYVDGLHPGDLGFTFYAKSLERELKNFGIV